LTVSLALLWTWGYNYGSQKNKPFFAVKDTLVSKIPSKDSLNQLYSNAVYNLNNLDSALIKADAVKFDLADKLVEFYKLKEEIATLLKNPDGSKGLANAEGKIGELQSKIDDLRNQNNSIIKENKRLSLLIAQLLAYQKPEKKEVINVPLAPKNDITDPRQNISTPVKSVAAEKNDKQIASSIFTLSNISVAGMIENENETKESDQADMINKFTGSFNLKNNNYNNSTGEIVVVVQKPDGKILKPTSWETGTFETKDGMRVFSTKVKFDCKKGVFSQISRHFFSILW
jgi:hypothetical protein